MEGLTTKEYYELAEAFNQYYKESSERYKNRIKQLLTINPHIPIIREDYGGFDNITMEMDIEIDGISQFYPIDLNPDYRPFSYHDNMLICICESKAMTEQINGIFEEFNLDEK